MEPIQFTPRELDVMSILWRLGSATVAEVRDGLDEPLAYTSVLSALQTLTEKGFVRHEAEGRAYRYFPTVAAEAAGGSAIARIREAIFAGSASRLLAQLVQDEGLPRAELERMRRLLDERLDAHGAPVDGRGTTGTLPGADA
jgi:predicted transcriptional regulator